SNRRSGATSRDDWSGQWAAATAYPESARSRARLRRCRAAHCDAARVRKESRTMNRMEAPVASARAEGAPAWVRHPRMIDWVRAVAARTKPDRIVWCDGSKAEYDRLCDAMVASGTLIRLDPVRRPGCFLARSDPADVARVEERTFICSERQDDAGPT